MACSGQKTWLEALKLLHGKPYAGIFWVDTAQESSVMEMWGCAKLQQHCHETWGKCFHLCKHMMSCIANTGQNMKVIKQCHGSQYRPCDLFVLAIEASTVILSIQSCHMQAYNPAIISSPQGHVDTTWPSRAAIAGF